MGNIAILRAPLETLVEGLEPADLPSPFHGGEWRALRGKSGAVFHAAAIDGGVLMVPFGSFATPEDVAVAVRGLLGAALDLHDEPRGIFIVSDPVPPSGPYDAAVGADGAFVPVPSAEDPRLSREAGWAFAGALASPEAKKRVESQTDVDPLASAKRAFEVKLAARADRGAMRETLTAALGHELEQPSDDAGEDGRVLDAVAARLRRAAAPAPDVIGEATSALREAVAEGEIAANEPDSKPPA